LETSLDMIKSLRQKTSAGVMDCKLALEETKGDIKKAEDILNAKGYAQASKRSGKETHEGIVESYIHAGGKLGALVEINCETDFVARTEDLKNLAHDLAMQVAAMPSTLYIDKGQLENLEQGVPEELCLLSQSFIKDPSLTVNDILQTAIAKVGENIKVRRFVRFALGE